MNYFYTAGHWALMTRFVLFWIYHVLGKMRVRNIKSYIHELCSALRKQLTKLLDIPVAYLIRSMRRFTDVETSY